MPREQHVQADLAGGPAIGRGQLDRRSLLGMCGACGHLCGSGAPPPQQMDVGLGDVTLEREEDERQRRDGLMPSAL